MFEVLNLPMYCFMQYNTALRMRRANVDKILEQAVLLNKTEL